MGNRDQLIDAFGKDVILRSAEDALAETMQDFRTWAESRRGPLSLQEAEALADRMARQAAAAALAGVFSSHELDGTFRIQLLEIAEDGSEERFDLGEEFGAPLNVAFFEDGWLAGFCKSDC